MSMYKRVIALILALCLVLPLVPADLIAQTVSAATGNTVNVTLKVGETKTYTETSGAYDTATTNPDASIVTMVVTGNTQAGEATYTTVSEIESGAQYLITKGNSFITVNTSTGYNGSWTSAKGLLMTTDTANQEQHLWTITKVDGGYTVKNANDKYLNIAKGNNNITLSDTPVVLSVIDNGNTFTIHNNNYALNNFGGSNTFASSWSGTGDTNAAWNLKKYSLTAPTNSTEITFTGVAIGTTTATVGNTTYNITVTPANEIDVELYVGYTKSYTDNSGNYEGAATNSDPDSQIATMVLSSTTGTIPKQLEPVTSATFSEGKQYVIVNQRTVNSAHAAYQPNHSVLTAIGVGDDLYMSGPVSAYTNDVWEIVSDDSSGYYIKKNGVYVTFGDGTAAMTTTATTLTFDYNTTAAAWTIKCNEYYLSDVNGINSKNACGYGSADDGNYWLIYEVQEETTSEATEIQFTGVAIGTTTAIVGNTQYNITVKPPEDVYIQLTVGQTSEVYYETTGHYGTTDPLVSFPNDVFATMALGENAEGLVEVTSIESGKQYLIVNKNSGDVLTDSNTIIPTSNNEFKTGLVTEEIELANSTEAWTITVTDAGYFVMQDGKYLTVAGYYANMSDTPTNLGLAYKENVGWMILDGETAGNMSLGSGYYYLCDSVEPDVADALGTSASNNEYIYWDIYEILPAHTTVTFTGVATGLTTARVGYTNYHITVVTGSQITVYYQADDSTVAIENYDVLSTTSTQALPGVVQSSDGKFYTVSNTTLTLTDATTYIVKVEEIKTTDATVAVNGSETLQLKDDEGNNIALKDKQYIIWTASDPSYLTVAADYDTDGTLLTNGVIIGNKATETDAPILVTGTVYNEDGTVAHKQHWSVTVTDADDSSNTNTRYIYINITRIQNTTVYYCVNGGELIEITDDMLDGPYTDERGSYYKLKVPLFNEVTTGLCQFSFFGAPDEGYALVEMGSTNSEKQFYALDNGHPYGLNSEAWPGGACAGVNNAVTGGNLTNEKVKVMYTNAIAKGADGVLFFTANNSGSPDGQVKNDVRTDLQFVSTKLPEMEKELNGVLPTSRRMADFRRYHGTEMVAAVGEYVYFTISVTMELPTAWALDSSGNETNVSALNYSASLLVEGLEGCYFYTKELDAADSIDGTMDGVIENKDQQATQKDITDDLNRAWTQEEIEAGGRVLEYFVVYPLGEQDIDKIIFNTVDFNFTYGSKYSNGTSTKDLEAKSNIQVYGSFLGSIVVDFGLPVSITDPGEANNTYGFGAAKDGRVECTYGSAVIKEGSDGKYVLTYTPNGILPAEDTVVLFNASGASINFFKVYPASTVYYEEGFIEYDTGWTFTGTKGDGEQELQFATGTVSQQSAVSPNNFGYDDKYANETGMSNGTQAESKADTRSTASFVFTGTGVDIYANCDTTTGIAYIMLYKGEGDDKTMVKLYQVATANADGTSGATDGQATTTDSLPIVAISDLEHGTYTVEIMTAANRGVVRLDGFRVYNTLTSYGSYPADEQDPTFIELRDEALSVQGITGSENAQQVFSESNKVSATVLYLKNGTEDFDVNDLLNNGPKNELWLFEGETLTFNLTQAAQIGLKAPSGSVTYVVSVDGSHLAPQTIKSATDMFYDVPAGAITIKVTSGNILSVTKLKMTAVSTAALSVLSQDAVSFALRVMSEVTHTHSHDATVTAPTCTEAGYTTYTCAECGDSYVADQTEALGHDYTDTVVPPTEESQGYTLHVCQRCGYEYMDNFVSLVTYGDVSGDGKIDGRDLLKLKRYLANYDPETGTSTEEVSSGADINGDGKIDGRDLLKLKRYLANYDPETGTSTEPLGPQG